MVKLIYLLSPLLRRDTNLVRNYNKVSYKLIFKYIAVLAVFYNASALDVYAAEPIPAAKTVKALTISTSEIYDTYQYPIVIEPKYEREMYSEITGFVQNIYVHIGAWVKKDAVLMQLKPTGPGYTEQAFTIKSPLDGQVAQVGKKIGSHVKSGDLLLHIVDPKDLTIKIEIPQAELALLQRQQKGDATFRVLKTTLPVIITGISSYISQTTGTATGQLDWDIANFKADESASIQKHIYPGMLGYVTFKLHHRNGIAIPSKAILHEKSVQKVRIIKDGKANKIIVQTGKHLAQGLQEITAGLQAGDVIVLATGKYIKENEAVIIEQ